MSGLFGGGKASAPAATVVTPAPVPKPVAVEPAVEPIKPVDQQNVLLGTMTAKEKLGG